jgi:hypothetical protein
MPCGVPKDHEVFAQDDSRLVFSQFQEERAFT